MRLQNKVAIVTGAASGFGEAIAHRFAQEGARVVVSDINDNAGRPVANAIAEAGWTARYVHADVSNADDVAGMVADAESAYGGLDILVNNAGYPQRNQPMLDVSEEEFDRIFAVNVKSLYLAALHGVPALRRRGGGVMINTASTAGISPRPGLAWYNGSKGAAITLTKSMAVELAPDRIRVCAINPVIGETGLTESFMGAPDTPENRAKFEATIPLGRFSTPGDVAGAALYLASDEAAMLTGVCLEVDGGRSI